MRDDLGEVVSRSAAPLAWWRHILGYPIILLERFQPAILPAIAGAVLIWKSWRKTGEATILLVAWLGLPLLLYSLSSAQSPRYVFSLLPAIALLGGCWLARRWPRVARGLRRAVALLLVAAAGVFWIRPELLRQPGNDAIKSGAALVAQAVPAGEAIPYVGSRYWTVANPFLYYAETAGPGAAALDGGGGEGGARALASAAAGPRPEARAAAPARGHPGGKGVAAGPPYRRSTTQPASRAVTV